MPRKKREKPLAKQRLVRVTVEPGDFNKVYKQLHGHGGAWQRPVMKGHSRKLLKSWDGIQRDSYLVLVEDKEDKGTYWILDGQHRLYAASELRGEPSSLVAVVRDANYSTTPLVEQVEGLNTVNKYTIGHSLHNYRGESIWPDAFKQMGLSPSFNSSNKTLNWVNILRGRLAALSAEETGKWTGSNPRTADILALWRDPDAAKAYDSAEVVEWWEGGARVARKKHKVNSLNVGIGLVAAHLFFWANSATARKGRPLALTKSPELHQLKGHTSWGESSYYFLVVTRGINYRKHVQNHISLGVEYS